MTLSRRAVFAALVLVPAGVRPAAAEPSDALRRSVVKLYTVINKPNYFQPWEMGYQKNSGGSGAIVAGRRILTNAHVVSDQAFIQALKVGDTRRYVATVEHVAHDSELALLKVDDPAFWEGTVPAALGELPRQRDKIAVYGFPIGGDELSITEGVVSRVEVGKYTHSQRDLLLVQTDAAINPGNSGGPVFRDGRLVGVAFQSYSGEGVENTGYLVPVPLVQRFLRDSADGRYEGIPDLGVHWQTLENEDLKAHYGLDKGMGGVLVTRVIHGSSAADLLQDGDVLTSVAGVAVADDGSVPLRGDERVRFTHALTRFQMGETAELSFIRDKRPQAGKVRLREGSSVIAGPQYDRRPTYFIFGGLVFTPLTFEYMASWEWKDVEPRFKYFYDWLLPSPGRSQIVIVSRVLAHGLNVGYHKVKGAVVEKVNGRPISRIEDVLAAVEHPVDGLHIVELDHHAGTRRDSDYFSDPLTRLVLRADKVAEADRQMLSLYGVPSGRSKDLSR